MTIENVLDKLYNIASGSVEENLARMGIYNAIRDLIQNKKKHTLFSIAKEDSVLAFNAKRNSSTEGYVLDVRYYDTANDVSYILHELTKREYLEGNIGGLTVHATPFRKDTYYIGKTETTTPVQASGTITVGSGTIDDATTITIAGVVYRFKSNLAQINDIKIATGLGSAQYNNDATLQNLVHAINGGGTRGTDYFLGTTPHPLVQATAVTSHATSVKAISSGTSGNAYTMTTTETEFTVSAVLSGGVDGLFDTNVICNDSTKTLVTYIPSSSTDVFYNAAGVSTKYTTSLPYSLFQMVAAHVALAHYTYDMTTDYNTITNEVQGAYSDLDTVVADIKTKFEALKPTTSDTEYAGIIAKFDAIYNKMMSVTTDFDNMASNLAADDIEIATGYATKARTAIDAMGAILGELGTIVNKYGIFSGAESGKWDSISKYSATTVEALLKSLDIKTRIIATAQACIESELRSLT